MKHKYDLVYLTNTPAFYKLNLCNEIAKKCSLLLVMYGYGKEAVNIKITNDDQWNFDYEFINNGNANRRNKVKTFINLLKLMNSINTHKIIFGGWFSPEYNLYSFFSPKQKNVVACESTIFECCLHGWKGWLKKCIINRMSASLPSGKPHAEIFKSIDFKGEIHITGGVGLFYKPVHKSKEIHKPLRYVFVGRLIDVKNIELLIDVFNKNKKPLTIVGDGYLREKLEYSAYGNIKFMGFLDNSNLGKKIYQLADVLILPSISETWGLVVEESIYWGLPVIVSDHVGCSIDIVRDLNTGVVFESKSAIGLQQAIEKIETNFYYYKKNVDAVDFAQRDYEQVKVYVDLCKSNQQY